MLFLRPMPWDWRKTRDRFVDSSSTVGLSDVFTYGVAGTERDRNIVDESVQLMFHLRCCTVDCTLYMTR